MRLIHVTGQAKRDVTKIIRHSSATFSDLAGQRYRRILDQELKILGADANRAGVQPIDTSRRAIFFNHLKWSRAAPAGPSVHQPRHLIAFSIDNLDAIIVARVFHKRMIFSRQPAEPDNR